MPDLTQLQAAFSAHLPSVLRWAGAIARQLRKHNIAVDGKSSGSASTDALTLADLSVQELIVAALRDRDPIFRQCRLMAEESTGDLACFAEESPYVIAIDPIDGTRLYRDHTGDGYSVIVMLQSVETVHYSLVYAPESGPQGAWVEAGGERIVVGNDDWLHPAEAVLRSFTPIDAATRPPSKNIYLIGFQNEDRAKADAVTAVGLQGFTADDMPASIFELQARGDFAGSLIHSPNIYDFPVSIQIARALGGDALWVHNREPVHFRKLWLDDRADMLRLPGIVACSEHRAVLDRLCDLAKDWNPIRYHD